MEVILFNLRILLSAVFGIAAVGKFLDYAGSKKAVEGFGVPKPLVAVSAAMLPVAELALSVSLLSTSLSWFGSVGALILLAAFLSAMGWQMHKGNAPDCHCFGVIHSEPVGKSSIVRNTLFALAAAVLVIVGPDNQGLSFTDMSVDLAVMFAISAAVVGTLLAAVFRLQRQVKVLEGAAGILAEVERDGVSHPDESLPIGAPAPDFEVRDIDGNLLTCETLLVTGRPFVLFFVGPTCEPCGALVPEIKAWASQFEGRMDFVLVSSGGVEENRDKFGEIGSSRLVIQQDRELSVLFRAKWTPAAVFVSDGRIASKVAVGDSQIRDLIDGLKTRDLSEDFVFVARGTPARVRIGEKVGAFSATDVEGREIDDSLLSGGATLVLFLSSTCSHCIAMLPEVKEWEASASSTTARLLVVAEGDPEMYRALSLSSPVVLEDVTRPLSLKLGMHGAPSAVLIDGDGAFASETAIGAPAIWSLVGKF